MHINYLWTALNTELSIYFYIDKIIYEWGKKGIKTPQDVANNRLKFKEKQEKKEKLELFDYDWFEDGEDEEN